MGYNNTCPEYFLNGKNWMECVSEEKDLKVIVSDDQRWEQLCSQTAAKANKILGLIKRNFSDRSKETIIPLFKSLVRPRQEYTVVQYRIHIILMIPGIKLVEGVQCSVVLLGYEELTL